MRVESRVFPPFIAKRVEGIFGYGFLRKPLRTYFEVNWAMFYICCPPCWNWQFEFWSFDFRFITGNQKKPLSAYFQTHRSIFLDFRYTILDRPFFFSISTSGTLPMIQKNPMRPFSSLLTFFLDFWSTIFNLSLGSLPAIQKFRMCPFSDLLIYLFIFGPP